MSTKYKHIDLPFPQKGINSDGSASQIGPDYCRSANNLVLAEPGVIRTRAGWTRFSTHASRFTTPGNGTIYGVASHHIDGDSYSLLNLIESDASWIGGATSGTPKPTAVYHITGGSAGTQTLNTVFSQYAPMGQSVTYAGTTYFVSDDVTGTATFTPRLSMYAAGGTGAFITAGGVTINNGATAFTLGTTVGATQLANMYLIVTGGATGPLAGFRYAYRIRTGSGTTGSLVEPYGLGESTTNVPNAASASTTISIRNVTEVPNCPEGISPGVGLFRDRIFVGSGYDSTAHTSFSYNRIKWCQVGQPQKWPAQNYIDIGDEGDAIVGFGTVPDGLLIFSATKTWVLTGYDESSFTVRQISGQIGCAVPQAVTYADGRCFWVSAQGIYASNGGTPVSITQSAPGIGTKKLFLSNLNTLSGVSYGGMTVTGDTLLVTFNNTQSGGKPMMACDLRTGAWVTLGSTTTNYNPLYFTRALGRMHGIGLWNVVDVTNLYEPESAVATATAGQYDEDYTSAGATVNTTLQAVIQFADLRIGRDAVKLRGLQFEHNCHYYNATSSPRVAWAVTLDADQNIDSSATAVGNIDARYIGNTGVAAPDKYFTTTFRDTASLDGATFRLSLTKTALTGSAKLLRISLLTDPQPTSVSRVDNPTL